MRNYIVFSLIVVLDEYFKDLVIKWTCRSDQKILFGILAGQYFGKGTCAKEEGEFENNKLRINPQPANVKNMVNS